MKRAIPLVPLVLLSGCDFLYGVKRSAPLTVDPTPQCVEQVLRGTAGITTVQRLENDSTRPPGLSHAFLYSGPDHVRGVLQYLRDGDGKLSFWQSNLGINRVPSQEEITATRPVMRQVELGLERQCGLAGLSSSITEWCRKEECPPL